MSEKIGNPIMDVEAHQHERALEFARREKDPAKMIGALRGLGQTYLKDGDAPKALTQFEAAIKLAEETEDIENQARLWGFKGMALKEIGNFQMARTAFNKSNQLARQLDHQVLICDSLIRIGMLQAETGEPSKAVSKLEQAYAIAVEQKDTRRIINIAKLLGNYFFQLESSAKAMDYYMDALGLAQETSDRPTECSLLLAVGNVQIQGEEYELAVANLEKGLNLASALEDTGNQISALMGLMKAKAYTDNMGLAQIYGDQALSIARHIQDADIEFSIIESVVGLLFGHEEFEAAIPKLMRGVELAEEKQDGSQKLNMLMGQAFASYQLGDAVQAETLYQQLLAEAERLQDQVADSTALGRLSAIYSEQGNAEKALDYAVKALEKAHQTENVGLVGEQQLLIALAHRDLGKHAKAEAYFADAKKSYQAIGNDELVNYIDELVAGGMTAG